MKALRFVVATASTLAVGGTVGCGSKPSPVTEEAPDASAATRSAATPAADAAQPLPPIRAVRSSEEREAIAAARKRANPEGPPGVLPGAPGEAAPQPGRLTRDERLAARDDPAARMRLHHIAADDPADAAADDPAADLRGEPAAGEAPTAPAMPVEELPDELRPGVRLTRGAADIRLVDLAIALEIKSRVPQGVSNSFPEMPRMFMCYSVYDNRVDATTVTHVWKRDGRVVSRVELEVGRSPKWRTWSRQRVKPHWTGEWACEVYGPGDVKLGVARFSAGQP